MILINCSYAIISNLNLTHGTVGFTIYHSDNNTISRINASFNSQFGLILGYSSRNNITESLFKKNGDTGLLILDTDISKDNMIYSNAFIENGVTTVRGGGTITNNAAGGNILNKWDNGTIGNYWDDYDGFDRNDNGIGDTPYLVTSYGSIFPTKVYDNFPIWDDGPEVSSSSSSSSSSDDEEVPPLAIPLGNYYLAFIIIPTLVLVFYYKKRKL